jgi:hypothetical protein
LGILSFFLVVASFLAMLRVIVVVVVVIVVATAVPYVAGQKACRCAGSYDKNHVLHPAPVPDGWDQDSKETRIFVSNKTLRNQQ